MSRNLLFIGAAVLWAVMMAALVRREFLPYLEMQAPPSYRTYLKEKREPGAVVRKIYFGGKPIGVSESVTEVFPDGSYRLRGHTVMDLSDIPTIKRLPGTDKTMVGESEVNVSPEYSLVDFTMKTRMLWIRTYIKGRREGEDLLVEYDLAILKDRTRIRNFPDDMALSDDIFPYKGGGSLKVGKSWKIKVVRPGGVGRKSIEIVDAYAEVRDRETRFWRDRLVEVYRVEIKWAPDPTHDRTADFVVYVDDDGRVIEQEMTFFGRVLRFVLEEERTLTPEEAADYKWRDK
ncbi:MAG: hypothetical protein ACYTAF_11735 [Planctomycetota bacterium]|jgi:hypothetical protein